MRARARSCFTLVLFALVLMPAAPAAEPPKARTAEAETAQETGQHGPWTDLLPGPGLKGWRKPTGDWQMVGKAFQDPENPEKLAVEGRYEIQVYDSFGKKGAYPGIECGGIYQRWDRSRGKGKEGFEGHSPRVNASRPPGMWQTFDVVFRAPRFDASGKKIANARFVKVVHNGQVVHENVALSGPTRGAAFRDEKPTGPLMFQGNHGPVAYRHIRVLPLGDDK